MKEHGQSVQFITFAKTQFSASVSEGDWDPHSILQSWIREAKKGLFLLIRICTFVTHLEVNKSICQRQTD